MVIKWNKDLFSIFKMEHRTPGNLRGFVQVEDAQFQDRHDGGAPLQLGR